MGKTSSPGNRPGGWEGHKVKRLGVAARGWEGAQNKKVVGLGAAALGGGGGKEEEEASSTRQIGDDISLLHLCVLHAIQTGAILQEPISVPGDCCIIFVNRLHGDD